MSENVAEILTTSSQPASGHPTSGQSASGHPTTDQPASEELTTDQPASGHPTSGQPASGHPTSGQPASSHPTTDQAASEELTTDQPASGHPTSSQPASGHPTSGQPASGHPTFGQPASGHPTSGQPASGHPTSGQPASGHPTTDQPASGHPTSGQPASGHPTSGQPASGHPTSGQPASGHPTSSQPASGHPTSSQPASGHPTSGQPASGHPASNHPVSSQPVSDHPASNYPSDNVRSEHSEIDERPHIPELLSDDRDEYSNSSDVQEIHVSFGRRPNLPFILIDSSEESTDSNDVNDEVQREPSPGGSVITAGGNDENTSNNNNHGPTEETLPPQANSTPTSATDNVFQTPKRRRIDSPANPNPLQESNLEENDESCSICFEPWTTSGKHRPASLKCGHLFGQSCIERWLRGEGQKCPHCNSKAKRTDIRIIFAKSIRPLDTCERDRALQELAQSKQRNGEIKMEMAELGCKYQMECSKLRTELQEAKNEIKYLRSRLHDNCNSSSTDVSLSQEDSRTKSQESSGKGQYKCDKTILIWEGGNCRVMAYSPFLGILVVSQPSTIPLFQGFGVRKISAVDFRTTEYVPLHSKLIRSMCFHPTYSDGLLLSCAMDKKIKLTSLISNTVVQQYDVPFPAWSCIWNSDDHNYFFVGMQNGFVLEYDVRKTDTFIHQMNTEGSRSPVVSLQYIPAAPFAHFRSGGLLVGQLDRISFFERKSNNEYQVHLLPLEGNLTSLFFETHTRQLLASFRNSTKYSKVRHMVCEMTTSASDEHICSCNVIQTFYGESPQTLLSRTSLVQHPTDKSRLLICVGEELACAVKIWDGKTFQFTQKISCGTPVLDICSISSKNNSYLLALTEKQVKLHKWFQC